MSELRRTLVDLQERKTLAALYDEKYEYEISDEEKTRVLDVVRDQIEYDVDKMIKEEIDYHEKTKPEQKRFTKVKVFSSILNAAGTIGIAITVPQESWLLIGIFGIVYVISQSLLYIFDTT